jgi:hypothetical protein
MDTVNKDECIATYDANNLPVEDWTKTPIMTAVNVQECILKANPNNPNVFIKDGVLHVTSNEVNPLNVDDLEWKVVDSWNKHKKK